MLTEPDDQTAFFLVSNAGAWRKCCARRGFGLCVVIFLLLPVVFFRIWLVVARFTCRHVGPAGRLGAHQALVGLYLPGALAQIAGGGGLADRFG